MRGRVKICHDPNKDSLLSGSSLASSLSTIMNSALRRVAGGRTTKLTSNASTCRSRGYSTAVSLEGERVRRAVEKVIAGQSGKVSCAQAICPKVKLLITYYIRNLQTPDDDLNSLRSRLAAGETLPAVTESHDYSNKDPQLGDYPVVPWTNNQRLPPNGWWDNQARRNYGDPVSPYNPLMKTFHSPF